MDTLEVIDLYLRAPVLYSKSSVANLFHRPLTVDAGVRMTDDILPKNGRESWKNYP